MSQNRTRDLLGQPPSFSRKDIVTNVARDVVLVSVFLAVLFSLLIEIFG